MKKNNKQTNKKKDKTNRIRKTTGLREIYVLPFLFCRRLNCSASSWLPEHTSPDPPLPDIKTVMI